jgi:hypothetical protein
VTGGGRRQTFRSLHAPSDTLDALRHFVRPRPTTADKGAECPTPSFLSCSEEMAASAAPSSIATAEAPATVLSVPGPARRRWGDGPGHAAAVLHATGAAAVSFAGREPDPVGKVERSERRSGPDLPPADAAEREGRDRKRRAAARALLDAATPGPWRRPDGASRRGCLLATDAWRLQRSGQGGGGARARDAWATARGHGCRDPPSDWRRAASLMASRPNGTEEYGREKADSGRDEEERPAS